MEDTDRQKLHLVWASVFLTAVGAFGLTLLLAFGQGKDLEVASGILFIAAGLVVVLDAILLLSSPRAGPGLLVIGRLLLWVAFACLFVAGALGGVSMAARVSFAVSQLGDVLVVGRPGTLAGVAAVPFYRRDSHSSLTGLVTGMRAALDLSPPGTKPFVLLVGVDQPYVRVETLRFLLAFAGTTEAVVPVDENGNRQVTCAVYPSAWLDRAQRADDNDRSLEEFLETVKVREIGPVVWRGWGEDGRSWFKVASSDSMDEARRRFGQ